MALTNKGKALLLQAAFRGSGVPTNYYLALVTTTPTADTNLMSDLTEITPPSGGYSAGGVQITPGDGTSGIGFDVLTENDTNDRGEIQLEDVAITPTGTGISGATYAVLTNDNGTVGSREVYAYWSLGGTVNVSAGQTLTLQNCEIRIA